MNMEYTQAQIKVVYLDAEDIVTNSLPWLSGSQGVDNDKTDRFWKYEE